MLAVLFFLPQRVLAQAGADAQDATALPKANGKLLLVLPFENRTGQASLDWIGEAVPEVLNQRLTSAGFMPIARNDRQYALEHLGLPKNFAPSRATSIRLAETLDAEYVVAGYYSETGTALKASAQILDVKALHLGSPVVEQADITRLLTVLNSLAWRVARTLDPKYPVAENTFVAAGGTLRLTGFENYIRGLVEAEPAERLRHLKIAVEQNPTYSPAWLALGQAYFADQQFEQAANAFGHLPKSDPDALQAEFYRGLAFFYTGSYAKAADAFTFVATELPLPEVVNNEGVTASRRGREAAAYFQQAAAADPRDADYFFNLAIALDRKGDRRGAQNAMAQAVKLRPQDTEIASFATSLRSQGTGAGKGFVSAADTEVGHADSPDRTDAHPDLPLERIKRSFNDASFRQAAAEMEQMQAMRIASLSAAERARALTREGQRYLEQGLLLEAERQFQSALSADNSSAAAHAGLAEVRQRDGDAEAARAEAQVSLKLQPNPTAYLVLARLEFASTQFSAASADADRALALDPGNAGARALKQSLQARGQPAS